MGLTTAGWGQVGKGCFCSGVKGFKMGRWERGSGI